MRTLPPIFDRNGSLILLRLVLNGILQAAMVIGTMFLVRDAFDRLLTPGSGSSLFGMGGMAAIALFTAGLLFCTVLGALLRMIELVDAERLGQHYIHRVRMTLFSQMSKFPPRTVSKRSSGGILLRFVGDLSALRTWVSRGLARIAVASIVVTLATGVLAYIDASLAVASLAILLLGMGGNLLLGPRMQRAINASRRQRGLLARNVNEKIRTLSVIQVFNQTRRERSRFRRHSVLLKNAMISRARITSLMRVVTDGSTALSMALLLSLGALEASAGMTTPGNVVGAMAVVGMISNAFRDFGRVHEYLQNARVSEEKIVSFLKTKTMRGRAASLPDLVVQEGAVVFEGASLRGILENISATAKGGSRIALIGPNGAGKSTLLQAAARLIDLSTGRILIDGQDLSKCNLQSVRNAIGIVSPDLPLLRGSVRFNLRYRQPGADEAEVARVRALCGLDEILDTLPGGEAYRLQEGGLNLSLGQRHRLALARAILGHPPVLILDEADANLDSQAEEILSRVVDEYPGTIIMATRSPKQIARADSCWHLEKGRLTRTTERSDKAEPLGPVGTRNPAN